jgi:4-hydroxybenzoate polyprenyltransferase
VFCAHIVVVLLVLAIIGDRIGRTPLWAETLLLVSTLIGLYAVALVSNRLDREERMKRSAQPVSARTGG